MRGVRRMQASSDSSRCLAKEEAQKLQERRVTRLELTILEQSVSERPLVADCSR
jgi:hypothetical protein